MVALAACGGDSDDGPGGWTLGFGGAGTDAPNALEITPSGGVAVTGLFSQTAAAGDVSLASADVYDAFVLVVDSDGAAMWGERLGGAGNDYGQALAVDTDGSVVVIGSFAEKVSLGDDTLSTTGGTDVFVARLSADGEPAWLRRFGGSGEDFGRGVAIAPDGDILIAGEFSGTAGFDENTRVQSMGETDVFYARLGPDGAPAWVMGAGGRGFDAATDIAADSDGGFALAGTFESSIHFAAQELMSKGFFDAFVAGFDAGGNARWARRIGDDNDDFARGVAAGAGGTIAVTGEFDGTVDFGAGEQTSSGYDAFVAVYSAADGGPLWSATFTGDGYGTGQGIAYDADDQLVFAGGFAETMSAGGLQVTSGGSNDVAVARFDPTGTCQWLQRFGGAMDDGAKAVTVDAPSGTPVIAGYFNGTGNFAHAQLTSAGARDAFVLSLPQAE
jgi:hypothetical protein